MGNCIRKEDSLQWGGEDWGSLTSETRFSGDPSGGEILYNDKPTKIQEKGLLGDSRGSSNPPFTTTEVKIKITKKQLEELLGKINVKGLPVQQVLAQLMSAGDGYEAHQRSWRPALQSIPEV